MSVAVNRWFLKLGYSRAAGVLRRAGLHEESDRCIESMNEL